MDFLLPSILDNDELDNGPFLCCTVLLLIARSHDIPLVLLCAVPGLVSTAAWGMTINDTKQPRCHRAALVPLTTPLHPSTPAHICRCPPHGNLTTLHVSVCEYQGRIGHYLYTTKLLSVPGDFLTPPFPLQKHQLTGQHPLSLEMWGLELTLKMSLSKTK